MKMTALLLLAVCLVLLDSSSYVDAQILPLGGNIGGGISGGGTVVGGSGGVMGGSGIIGGLGGLVGSGDILGGNVMTGSGVIGSGGIIGGGGGIISRGGSRCDNRCPFGSSPDSSCRCRPGRWNPCQRMRCRQGTYCVPRGRRGVCVYRRPCMQPVNPGPCRGSFRRYYYNRFTGQCQRFIYGGCGGNQNNFYTWRQCMQSCGRRLPFPIGPIDQIDPMDSILPIMYSADPSSDS